jgi:CubicO group peptidase (beta-lactamase class C family)
MAQGSEIIEDYLRAEIDRAVFPGAQYAVGEDDVLAFEGALGHSIIEPEQLPSTLDTIYDLASLTKPLVTSLLCVRRVERGILKMDAPVCGYLSEFDTPRARHITLGQLMTHTSGLPNWLPLYCEAARPQDVPGIIAGKVTNRARGCAAQLVYSDLNYILLGFILERLSNESLDKLASKEIFEPLGLKRTMFNPPEALRRETAATERGQEFERNNALALLERGGRAGCDLEIASSGYRWRRDVIWGEVHDGNARFLGGVAGHAGLFSTAREVYEIAKQFLPGSRLISPASLKLFTETLTTQCDTSRSIGWIIPLSGDCSAGPGLPRTAIGHNGFTGTSLWMDPGKRRILVLLTNRVHPMVKPIDMKPVRQRFNALGVEALDRAL